MPASPLQLADAKPGSGEPPRDRSAQTRGLALARRVEGTRELLRRARRHVKRSKKPSKRKSLKQLRRFKLILAAVEQDALGHGVSADFARDVTTLLTDAEDALDYAITRPALKKRHLQRLRRDIRDIRRRFEAMLGPADA